MQNIIEVVKDFADWKFVARLFDGVVTNILVPAMVMEYVRRYGLDASEARVISAVSWSLILFETPMSSKCALET